MIKKRNLEFVAVLHNIRSLQNVGSIFRTADGAGIKKLYLCGITPAPVDRFGEPRRQMKKVSLGAEEYVDWEKKQSTSKLIKELKKAGYKILAIEQSSKSILYYKFLPKFPAKGEARQGRHIPCLVGRQADSKFCLIVGNEVSGIPKAILKLADKILEIPMRGKKESLNVSVAFGIAAYDLSSRARRTI